MGTKPKSRPILLCGLVVAMAANPGCPLVTKKAPSVIALPGESVPHAIKKGEPADYEGWVLPTPLFNQLLPCFRDRLEHPERFDGDVPPPDADDGFRARTPRSNTEVDIAP